MSLLTLEQEIAVQQSLALRHLRAARDAERRIQQLRAPIGSNPSSRDDNGEDECADEPQARVRNTDLPPLFSAPGFTTRNPSPDAASESTATPPQVLAETSFLLTPSGAVQYTPIWDALNDATAAEQLFAKLGAYPDDAGADDESEAGEVDADLHAAQLALAKLIRARCETALALANKYR